VRKLRGLLWRLAVVGLVLAWAFSGGPLLAVGEWLLFGYLCWRAAPGVGADLGRVSGLFAGRAVGSRRVRGRGGNTL